METRTGQILKLTKAVQQHVNARRWTYDMCAGHRLIDILIGTKETEDDGEVQRGTENSTNVLRRSRIMNEPWGLQTIVTFMDMRWQIQTKHRTRRCSSSRQGLIKFTELPTYDVLDL